MERRFRRTVDALEEVFGFISDFAARHRLGEDVLFGLNLAIEEVFVNMVRHTKGDSDILIELNSEGTKLIASMTDFDVEAFDLTKADEYDTHRPLEDRPIGRLGIHLVKSVVDEITYDYHNGQSRITMIKSLGRTDVQD
jgi:serine/threonine-protein kinase RsbW